MQRRQIRLQAGRLPYKSKAERRQSTVGTREGRRPDRRGWLAQPSLPTTGNGASLLREGVLKAKDPPYMILRNEPKLFRSKNTPMWLNDKWLRRLDRAKTIGFVLENEPNFRGVLSRFHRKIGLFCRENGVAASRAASAALHFGRRQAVLRDHSAEGNLGP